MKVTNPTNYDLRIDVEAIHKGVTREINYARIIRSCFESNDDMIRYFGLRQDGPVAKIIAGF